MKIWHDDIRRPPDDSWTWCRTNEAACRLLNSKQVTEISLDHDLGLDHLDPLTTENADYLQGDGTDTGAALVRWMIDRGQLPEIIEIHSWSAYGRETMAGMLREAGIVPEINPFDPACRLSN